MAFARVFRALASITTQKTEDARQVFVDEALFV